MLMMLLVVGMLFVSGCGSPLLQMSSTELRNYSIRELIWASGGGREYSYSNTWAFDPEIDQELIRRQKNDIEWLIKNAHGLDQFETIHYSFQDSTQASRIMDKYDGIPLGIHVGGLLMRVRKFTPVSAKWLDSEVFYNARRKWYLDNHPDISSEIRQCLLDGTSTSAYNKVMIGMTKEQMIVCKGYPNDVNTTVGSWGSRNQWVYGGVIGGTYFPIRCYYFEGGRLTSWQD